MLRVLPYLILMWLLPVLAGAAEGSSARNEFRIVVKVYSGETLLTERPLQFIQGMVTGGTGETGQPGTAQSIFRYLAYADDAGSHSGFRQIPPPKGYEGVFARAQHFSVDDFNLYLLVPGADRFEAAIYSRTAPASAFDPINPNLPAGQYGEQKDTAGFVKVGWLSGSLTSFADEVLIDAPQHQ
jgi:hypothetical protein